MNFMIFFLHLSVQINAEHFNPHFDTENHPSLIHKVKSKIHFLEISGSCGDTVTWTFDTNSGILSISGTGEMNNFVDFSNQPWYEYANTITAVSIENGVTYIGTHAFDGCDLQSI